MAKYISTTLLITLGSFVAMYLLVLIDPSAIYAITFVFILLLSIVITLQIRIIEILKRK